MTICFTADLPREVATLFKTENLLLVNSDRQGMPVLCYRCGYSHTCLLGHLTKGNYQILAWVLLVGSNPPKPVSCLAKIGRTREGLYYCPSDANIHLSPSCSSCMDGIIPFCILVLPPVQSGIVRTLV